MFHFKEMPYYIEDHSTKRERSDFAFDKPVYGSDYLINEDRENLFILICDDDEEYAANKLESMGFKEGVHYAFGEELLIDLTRLESIRRNGSTSDCREYIHLPQGRSAGICA